MKNLTVALTGNPNCGKTTLFNRITGSKHKVGNWPGVTVERLEGDYTFRDVHYDAIDLPGIYSFSVYSADERVSREYILNEKPDVVINVVDATNLERNLYLTTQLLEMKVPMVVALNKMDAAERRKLHIEIEHLAKHLDCPVIPVSAARGEGMEELRLAVENVANTHHIPQTKVSYNHEIEESVERLEQAASSAAHIAGVDKRWLAVKLLEQDELAIQLTKGALKEEVRDECKHINKHTGEDADLVIADGRYGFIHGLARDVVKRNAEFRQTMSDLVDRIVLSRQLSIPIFLLVMYFVFWLTIQVGGPFIDFFDGFTGAIFVDGLRSLLEHWHAPEFLTLLLADGLGSGIQMISTFIPPVFFIFLCLSLLEGSGYMSRAAFVMDRMLRTIGLPGKAFIPMLVGFGCNVPAILAARTLERKRDQILTILLNPFMSCGARLPVYTLFAVLFFPQHRSHVVFGMYLIGVLVAVLSGLLFKNTLFPGEVSSYVMELPPYHMPPFSVILHDTWTRLKDFIWRAGKAIVVIVALLQIVMSVTVDGRISSDEPQNSLVSEASRKMLPIFEPMGMDKENWPAVVGLVSGVFAKEAVIATLDSLYTQVDAEEQPDAVTSASYGPRELWSGIKESFAVIPEGLAALFAKGEAEDIADESQRWAFKRYFKDSPSVLAYLIFILLYVPCGATLAAIAREINWKWMTFSAFYMCGIAWVVSTLFYQLATFAAHPGQSLMWLAILTLTGIIFYVALKAAGKRITFD
ncbi:Fe(2+) transporter permease subunit FeoB [Verrucomicrobiota bacterium]